MIPGWIPRQAWASHQRGKQKHQADTLGGGGSDVGIKLAILRSAIRVIAG
jgi:hypothetical protein